MTLDGILRSGHVDMGFVSRADGGAVMKRLLPWVFPAAIVVFLILQMTHTGPANLWMGMAAGVLVLWVYLVASSRPGWWRQ
jgi:hypothetical protein